MFEVFVKVMQRLSASSGEDMVDRNNYFYSSFILLFICLGLSARTYFGEHMQCWMPSEFRSAWGSNMESECYANGTYFLPSPVREFGADNGIKIEYYQWVPYSFIVQIIICILPRVWYSSCSKKINLRKILGSNGFNVEASGDSIAQATNRLKKALSLKNKSPRYSSFVYITYKFLSLLSMALHVFLLHKFLNTPDIWFGYKILNDILAGRTWEVTGAFPRWTYCDVSRRDDTSSTPMEFTVGCSLNVNPLFEKIYIAIWFWIAISFVVTAINTLYWIWIIFHPSCQKDFVRSYLNEAENPDAHLLIRNVLKTDGVLTLRFIEMSVGSELPALILRNLYSEFKNSPARRQASNLPEMV